ncbi:uncharacterized protein [Leptinotarsa decemlineata]
MFLKTLVIGFFLTYTSAIRVQTSYAAFNKNHNALQHIHSQHNIIQTNAAHYSVPSHFPHVHAAPQQSAPVFSSSHGAPRPYPSISSSHRVQASHVAPAVYTAPVVHTAQALLAAPVLQAVPDVHSMPVFQNVFTNQYDGIQSKQYTPSMASHAAPVLKKAHHEEEYSHPKYQFAYGVEDHHTGNIHSHNESRDGDSTQGEYSLHEADGTIRTVKYTVEKHGGFNAIVERSGHPHHPQTVAHHSYQVPHHQ